MNSLRKQQQIQIDLIVDVYEIDLLENIPLGGGKVLMVYQDSENYYHEFTIEFGENFDVEEYVWSYTDDKYSFMACYNTLESFKKRLIEISYF